MGRLRKAFAVHGLPVSEPRRCEIRRVRRRRDRCSIKFAIDGDLCRAVVVLAPRFSRRMNFEQGTIDLFDGGQIARMRRRPPEEVALHLGAALLGNALE